MTPTQPNNLLTGAEDEISALIESLRQTSARLEQLTAGEVDAVADREGRTFILQHVQEQLRVNELARLAAILNALPAHVALVDARGRILAVNTAWQAFAFANEGQSLACPLGLNYLEVCDGVLGAGGDDARRVAKGLRAVLDGEVTRFETEYRCDSPTEQRWFLVIVTPVAGPRPNGAVVMHMNVSLQHQTNARLNASELMFSQMAESIGDVFFLRDLDSRHIHYVSPAYETIWGRSRASLYANPTSWTMAIHPEDPRLCDGVLGDAPNGDFDVKYRILRPDGGVRWIHSRGYPVRDENGAIVRVAGLAKDVTEHHRSELELAAAHVDLQRSNRDLQDFAFIASHDLQEPLRKVLVLSERLLRIAAVADDPVARDFCERNVRAVQRMQTLINDLLTLSKVSIKGKAFKPVDLQKLALGVLDDLGSIVENSSARVEIGDLPTIDGDSTQLRQVFQNLIANALKFHRDGVPPWLRISAATVIDADDVVQCQIVFEDNGIGFEAQHAESIFTVFKRLHGQSEYEGSGIGLAVVLRVLERHHGKVKATSTPGVGSRFQLTLPQHQAHADAAANFPAGPSSNDPATVGSDASARRHSQS